MSMPSKKLSGFQNRKRKQEQEIEARKSKKIMDLYLFKKKKNSDETVEQNKSESPSNSYGSSIVSKLTSDTALQCEEDSEDFHDESEIKSDNLSSSSSPITINENNSETFNVISEVLKYNDVAYLNFNQNFPIISDELRTEIIIRGSHVFQNESILNRQKTTGKRLMPKSWFYRQVGNEGGIQMK